MFVYNTLLGEIDFDYIWLDFEASVLLFMKTIENYQRSSHGGYVPVTYILNLLFPNCSHIDNKQLFWIW